MENNCITIFEDALNELRVDYSKTIVKEKESVILSIKSLVNTVFDQIYAEEFYVEKAKDLGFAIVFEGQDLEIHHEEDEPLMQLIGMSSAINFQQSNDTVRLSLLYIGLLEDI